VAKEFREARKFGPMLGWFEGAWNNLANQTPSQSESWDAEREKAIYDGYREVLTALGRPSDRADLDRAWTSRQQKAKDGPQS
jgi:hypothetical protein